MHVADLWLPILLAGLAAHILSTLAWMALPHHKPEWQKLPVEDDLIKLLDDNKVSAHQYMFPFARDPNEMKSEEYQSKQAKCRGMLILWPTAPNMGAAIGKTLAFFFFAAFVIGYVAAHSLKPGDSFLNVFRLVTTLGLMTHCFAYFPNVFWFRRKVVMELVDGVAYAVATGLIFAALWPSA